MRKANLLRFFGSGNLTGPGGLSPSTLIKALHTVMRRSLTKSRALDRLMRRVFCCQCYLEDRRLLLKLVRPVPLLPYKEQACAELISSPGPISGWSEAPSEARTREQIHNKGAFSRFSPPQSSP